MSSYANDKAMLAVGLSFSLLTLIVQLFMIVTMTSCRRCLKEKCGCKCLEEGSALDEKLSAVEEGVMKKLKQYLVKRMIMSKLRR